MAEIEKLSLKERKLLIKRLEASVKREEAAANQAAILRTLESRRAAVLNGSEAVYSDAEVEEMMNRV